MLERLFFFTGFHLLNDYLVAFLDFLMIGKGRWLSIEDTGKNSKITREKERPSSLFFYEFMNEIKKR